MTTTTISYQLNGQPLDGWDEYADSIDLELAASNLTDVHPGDVLTARLEDLDDDGRLVVIDEQKMTL